MKNKIVRLLIGMVALTAVTGATVSARTFAIGLSVGGASLIEGSLMCTTPEKQSDDKEKTVLTAGFSMADDLKSDTTDTVNTTDDFVTAYETLVADNVALADTTEDQTNASQDMTFTEIPVSSNDEAALEGNIEETVSDTETNAETLDPSAQPGTAPEGSKIAALEESLNAEIQAEAEAAAAADSIMISAGAVDSESLISLPAEGEEEDDVDTLYGYTNLGIAIVDDHLNVRETADDSSKIVGKMSNDSGCEILDVVGNKAHIVSGSVEGYVTTDYLLTGDLAKTYASQIVKKLATVSADGLKVRSTPDLEGPIVNMVAYGEELEVVEELDGWVKVLFDGQEAYVNADYVTVGENLKTALNMSEFLFGEGVSDVRVSLCEYAKQFLGNPYVWGGTSLTKGADCSGYVLSIFGKYGYSLPHSSRAQATMGTKVTVAEAKPGDLVFYSKGGHINHVAIYIGGGQVIHASSPKYGIRITSVYYRTPTTVRRIIQD
ncbi:MAG: NlpC/P60 family protein [Lachnospiraceae bacterium]|nr:NlpC/P60 family protein [Lachnospiraceae bacterium]MDD5852547.1 NlpC/P60 family protein [Lachnospiraceae bacterium]